MTQNDNGPGPGRKYGEMAAFMFSWKVVFLYRPLSDGLDEDDCHYHAGVKKFKLKEFSDLGFFIITILDVTIGERRSGLWILLRFLCFKLPPSTQTQHELSQIRTWAHESSKTRHQNCYKGERTNGFATFQRCVEFSSTGACGEFLVFSGKIRWHFQPQPHGYFITIVATCWPSKRQKSVFPRPEHVYTWITSYFHKT